MLCVYITRITAAAFAVAAVAVLRKRVTEVWILLYETQHSGISTVHVYTGLLTLTASGGQHSCDQQGCSWKSKIALSLRLRSFFRQEKRAE